MITLNRPVLDRTRIEDINLWKVRAMAASMIVEIESGTSSGLSRQHNGYFAGEFRSTRPVSSPSTLSTGSSRPTRIMSNPARRIMPFNVTAH